MKNFLLIVATLLLALQGQATEIWPAVWQNAQSPGQAQFVNPFVQQTSSNGTLNDSLWTAVSISDNNGQNTPGSAYWTRSLLGYSEGINSNNVPLGSPTQGNGVALFDSDFMDTGGIGPGSGTSPAAQRGELISPVINLIGYTDTALGIKLYMRYDVLVLNELSVSLSTDNGVTWGPAHDLTTSHANECEGWSTVLFTEDPFVGVINLSSCRIKFTFEGAYNYVLIDDVSLFTGNSPTYSSWNQGTGYEDTYSVVEGVQCDGGPYTSPSGKVWNAPGVYHDTIANSFSRDSIMTICLVTGSSTTAVDTIAACGSYTWIDGITYTSSNSTAMHTITNASGCDSVVTLNLSIIPLVAETLTIAQANHVCVGTSTVTIANTQTGFNYYLRNDADNSIVDGPLAGTGAAASLNTDTVSQTTAYNVIGGITAQTALVFDGLDEGVTIPNNVVFDFDTGTVELWFRPDANDNVNRTLMSMRSGLFGATRWSLHYNAVQQKFGVYNGVSFATGNTVAIQQGDWNHVAFRMTLGGMEVVLNGTSTGTINIGILSSVTGENLMIGAHTDPANDEEWIGAIDDVRVWNVLRSVAEIDAAKDSCYTGTETGLLAFYDFEDSGDGTLDDLTGNGHHGALTNMDPNTDWVASGKACWACSIEMANTVTLTIDTFPADSIVTTSSLICDTLGGTTTFDVSGSSVGLLYVVFDTAFTFLTQGVPGTGGPITLTSDTITAPTLLGVYVVNTTDASICTTIMPNAHSVSFASPTGSTDTQVACDSLTWMDGTTYTASNNTATFVLTNSAGCDSVIALDLTILNSTSSTDTQVACGSYLWIDGTTYTSSNNTATFTMMNAAGCDSVITLNLTINQPDSTVDTQTACNSYTWIDGTTYTASNSTATFTLTNAAGCDSVITLNLTIVPVLTSTDTQVACGAFTWIDGTTYTASNNTATDTLMSAAGCDSIVTLNLTIHQPSTGTDVQTACGAFTWMDGNTYTASNSTATDTLVNAVGCDSIVTLNLTINQPSTGTDTQTACGSYTWIDGTTYTASNSTAMVTLSNAAGCDSVVTLDLTINTVDVSVTNSDPTLMADAAAATYQWLDCDDAYAVIAGETSQGFEPTTNGAYAVEITQAGCTDTSACQTVMTVGLWDQQTSVAAQLYPNPSAGSVELLLGQPLTTVTISATNAMGQVVYSQRHVGTNRLQIDLPAVAGLYFIKIEETGQVMRAVVK